MRWIKIITLEGIEVTISINFIVSISKNVTASKQTLHSILTVPGVVFETLDLDGLYFRLEKKDSVKGF